jgi:hypothetical protein
MSSSPALRSLPSLFLTILASTGLALASHRAVAETPRIEVYKTPTCGCCTLWIDHLREAGFAVEARELPDLTALKAANGVPPRLASCHTALVDGYVIEGHVPARDVERLLKERPSVAGLAVPGMPIGSPGMEHPDPRRHEAYDVLAFGPEGVEVFATHRP